MRKGKGSGRAKIILKKKDNIGRLTLPDPEFYYKATAINTGLCWLKKQYINQWKRIEIPEINPHIWPVLI